ncbi:MAG TPA: imidazolonepropionase [Acidobacteriota bacterium]
MLAADAIVEHCSAVATLSGQGSDRLGIVPDGAVALIGERIAWVGRRAELGARVALSAGARRMDAGGALITPGWIDPHTHLIFGGDRADEFERRLRGASYQQIAAAGGGILSTVRATRAAPLEELVERGRRALDRYLDQGVTTLEAKSGYGLELATELKMLEAIRRLAAEHPIELVPTFLGAHEVAPEFRGRTDAYVEQVIEEMIPAVAGRKLARFCDVFCEQGVFDRAQSRRILEAGRAAGLIPKFHADEFVDLGGASLAAELGAASADHLLVANPAGIAAMARAGVVATLLPGTPYFLGLGRYANARAFLAAGVEVALATDFNPGSCMTENLGLVMNLAATQMKLVPAECLRAVTLGAARALGLERSHGSIEAGKQADLALFDVPDYRHLVYHFGVNHCVGVIKAGRWARPRER